MNFGRRCIIAGQTLPFSPTGHCQYLADLVKVHRPDRHSRRPDLVIAWRIIYTVSQSPQRRSILEGLLQLSYEWRFFYYPSLVGLWAIMWLGREE